MPLAFALLICLSAGACSDEGVSGRDGGADAATADQRVADGSGLDGQTTQDGAQSQDGATKPDVAAHTDGAINPDSATSPDSATTQDTYGYGVGQVVYSGPMSGAAAALASAGPGQVVEIASGSYNNVSLNISKSGTAAAPLILRAKTAGGVTISGDSRIVIGGDHVIVSGFVFKDVRRAKSNVVRFLDSQHSRLTNSVFDGCGDLNNRAYQIIKIDRSSHCRVDHCYITASRAVSLGYQLYYASENGTVEHNRFDHNVFHRIEPLASNTLEAVQLGAGGQSGGASVTDLVRTFTVVERNLFWDARGDSEIISSKTSANIIRENTFINSSSLDPRGQIVLRGGDDALVAGNVLVNTYGCVTLSGEGHRIINNYCEHVRDSSIRLRAANLSHSHPYRAVRGALIIHNTVISPYAFKSKDAPASAIRLEDSTASNNDIANNLLVVDQADSRAMEGLGQGNRFANNLIWVKTPAVAGDALPSGGALSSQDPLLTAVGGVYRPSSSSPVVNAGAKGFAASVVADIDGETRDKSPDVGCDEVRSASSSPRRRAKDLLPAWIVSRYTL